MSYIDSPDMDAIIITSVSSGYIVLLMFLTADVVYVLRKKVIVVREAREHNAESIQLDINAGSYGR